MATPHSAFFRRWRNAIFLYDFWLSSSEMIDYVFAGSVLTQNIKKIGKKSQFRLFQEMAECHFFLWFLTFFIRNDCLGVHRVCSNPVTVPILPFSGNGGMPFFLWFLFCFFRNDCLGVHRVCSNPEHKKNWEKVMATPHSAFFRKWRNAIFFYDFWLFSSEMIV